MGPHRYHLRFITSICPSAAIIFRR
jgi:hypothetical protein